MRHHKEDAQDVNTCLRPAKHGNLQAFIRVGNGKKLQRDSATGSAEFIMEATKTFNKVIRAKQIAQQNMEIC